MVNEEIEEKLAQELKKIGISREVFNAILLMSPLSTAVPGYPIPTHILINENI